MWKKKKTDVVVQTAAADRNVPPFHQLYNRTAHTPGEWRLYRALRDNVPIIDAAIDKIICLVGGFHIESENPSAAGALNRLLQNIQVNACSYGIENFLGIFMSQLLTYGTAVGEIIPDADGIRALYNPPLEQLEISVGENPLDIHYFSVGQNGERKKIRYPQLIVTSMLHPEAGEIYGQSVLKGLPFVSNILMTIYDSIGKNWERVGNVRFAVSYNPPENEKMFLKERVEQIASEWSKTVHSTEPRDFISVGNVQIHAIGADNQILDSEIPVRQLLEQIIAKLSIPPFLLGLNWSSTERMSAQQADILTSELEYYRRLLNPIIEKICRTHLNFMGERSDFSIEWDDINLQDTLELSQARLNNAKAAQAELENEIERR